MGALILVPYCLRAIKRSTSNWLDNQMTYPDDYEYDVHSKIIK